jgi:hypothetical protein
MQDNLKDEFGNIHPAIRSNYSATVELYFHFDGKRYEIGSLGPGFAHLRDELVADLGEGEIETIISGKVTRWPVRITSPIAGDSTRFTFEGLG